MFVINFFRIHQTKLLFSDALDLLFQETELMTTIAKLNSYRVCVAVYIHSKKFTQFWQSFLLSFKLILHFYLIVIFIGSARIIAAVWNRLQADLV